MTRKDVWNLQVPQPLNKAVEKAVEMDFHASKAEFIRDAVREKLKRMGITFDKVER